MVGQSFQAMLMKLGWRGCDEMGGIIHWLNTHDNLDKAFEAHCGFMENRRQKKQAFVKVLDVTTRKPELRDQPASTIHNPPSPPIIDFGRINPIQEICVIFCYPKSI